VWQKRQGKASITGMFARNKEAATTTPTEANLLEEQAGANPSELR
jgi:hypothetical protein